MSIRTMHQDVPNVLGAKLLTVLSALYRRPCGSLTSDREEWIRVRYGHVERLIVVYRENAPVQWLYYPARGDGSLQA